MNPFLKKTGLFFFCLALSLAPAFTVWAKNARLTDIIVTNTRDHLVFFTTIKGAFNEKITQAVKDGVPASFTFIITLHQVRGFWFNKTISEVKVAHTIEYNTLKEEFVVTRSWQKDKTLTTRSFAEASERMRKIEGLALCPMSALEKGAKYRIQAKAELDKMTLPFYLHYILFFLSFWDVETDWHTVKFIY